MPVVHAAPAPATTPAVAQKLPGGHLFSVSAVLPVPTQLPAEQVPEQVGSSRLPVLP